jgi:hypothetical protein
MRWHENFILPPSFLFPSQRLEPLLRAYKKRPTISNAKLSTHSQTTEKIGMPIDLNAAPSEEEEDAILDLNLRANNEDGEGVGIHGGVVQAVEDQIPEVEDHEPAVHSSIDLNLHQGKFYFVVVTVQ